jgi:putative endonuclease
MFADKHSNRRTGLQGEDIAKEYLEKKGLIVIRRNFILPFAEIDIICEEKEILHIVEVKSMVSGNHEMKPEDHLNREKLKRLRRAAQYIFNLNEFGKYDEVVIDLIAITLPRATSDKDLTETTKECVVNYYENISFDQ